MFRDAWFYFSGHMSTQTNRQWSAEDPHCMYEILLCHVEVGHWCTPSLRRITGPVYTII
jgi:hypothetical protein